MTDTDESFQPTGAQIGPADDVTPVVILGGLANALSVGRSLGGRGIPVYFFGDRWAGLRFSRYCRQFVEIPPGTPERYWEPLVERGPGRGVVIPCGDDALEFVARRRRDLETAGYLPIEAHDQGLLAMLDKERAYEIARSHAVRCPRTVPVSDLDGLPGAVQAIGFPAALKPRVSHAFARHFAGKAVVVHTVDAAEATFRQLHDKGIEVVLTEIIPGPEGSYWGYYTYVDEQGVLLWEFTKRKLRQYPLGFGLGTLHRMERNDAVLAVGRKFVEGAGLRGLVNAEFKEDARDGEYVFIECNHRITAANELMVAAGIDLGSYVYDRIVGVDPAPVEVRRDDLALWWPVRDTAAALQLLFARELTVRRWMAGLRGRILLPAMRVTDPLPFVSSLLRGVARFPARVRRLARMSRVRMSFGRDGSDGRIRRNGGSSAGRTG